MNESTLLKIALIVSLIGLFILYFISSKIEVKDYNPSELNKNIGDDVKLIGTVTKISDRGDVVFLEIGQQNKVAVVVFDDAELKLNTSDNVEIFGEVQEYNGKNEIIAKKIRVIR